MRAAALFVIGTFALASAPGGALALDRERRGKPPQVPMTAAGRKAVELTERAYELQRQGALNDAIRLYEEALALEPLPKRHRNLAIPLEQAGRFAEALREYWLFERDALGEPEAHREDVAERVARLLPRLGQVELALPKEAHEAQAEARLLEAGGDRPRCVAQRGKEQVYLCHPGTVAAELRIRGQVVARRQAEVRAGGRAALRFVLQGEVRISANRPRPEVLIDGAPLRLPGPLPVTVPALLGGHELVARDGQEVLRQRFLLREGAPAAVELRFAPSRRWVYFVIGGAALVAAGVGAGVAGWAATRPPPPGGADLRLDPPQ
jgi:hypothetical protein